MPPMFGFQVTMTCFSASVQLQPSFMYKQLFQSAQMRHLEATADEHFFLSCRDAIKKTRSQELKSANESLKRSVAAKYFSAHLPECINIIT